METPWNPSSSSVKGDSPSTSGLRTASEKKKKQECPKLCAICGDKAAGINYDIASCYGCKSFFRRTLEFQTRYFCSYEGKCKASISKAIRLRCRACRFDRCVELGMNPLAVNAVTDKDTNKLVHEVLRRQRNLPSKASSNNELLPVAKPVECKYERLIEEMIYLDEAHQRLRRSQFNPDANSHIPLEWCLAGPSRMGIEFGEMPLVYPPPPLPHEFIPIHIRIRDRIPFGPCVPIMQPTTFKKWVMVDLIYTIEWLKTFDFFNLLGEIEKVQLVKNITQLVSFLTAAFYSYDERRSDITIMPDGQLLIQGELPKEATIERAHSFEIIERLKALRMDKKEYVLLKAIMACNPDHEVFCPESRRSLQTQREVFTKCLMSYLLARRGPTQGPIALTRMLSLIPWQWKIVKEQKDLYLLMEALRLHDPFMPQVMKEVYST